MRNFRNIGKRGEEGGNTLGTIAAIIIILVVVVVLIFIFTNRTKGADEYLEALKACQGLGGTCVSESETQLKRDSGYSCFETCPNKDEKGVETEKTWCCYKMFE